MKKQTQKSSKKKQTNVATTVREVVFGLEDGMVSTLGVITGIAVGTSDHFVVILSGFVVVAVEALSMSAGTYLSSKSVKEIEDRTLTEEKNALRISPEKAKKSLQQKYIQEGVDSKTAKKLVDIASSHEDLFFAEIAHHQLSILSEQTETPGRNAWLMGFSYVVGGAIPVVPYFFLAIGGALAISVAATLIGLFVVGAMRTKYTLGTWYKSGFELMTVSAGAALVGYIVAKIVEVVFNVSVSG